MNPLDLRFPLDDDCLPLLVVDAETIRTWTTAAKAEVASVIHNRDSWYFRGDELTGAFKLAFEQESLRGFTRTNALTPEKREFLCHGNLQLALDDVASALYSDTTFAFRSVQVQLYQDSFLDAAVLHVAERQTADEPFRFAGVKWSAHSAPSASLGAPPRDFVYFEYLCKTRDAQNRPVVVQYIECPELEPRQLEEHDMGLARASMFTINTFRVDATLGGTYFQSAGSLELPRGSPSGAVNKALTALFRSSLHLSGLADACAIAQLGVLKTVPAQPDARDAKKTKKHCYVCEKKFHVLTRSRISCRACGRGACRSCIVPLKFFNEASLFSSSLPVLTERFCLKCVMNAREHRRDGRLSRTSSARCSSPGGPTTSSFASDSTSGSRSSDERTSSSVSSETSLLTRNTIDAGLPRVSAPHVGPPGISRSFSEGMRDGRKGAPLPLRRVVRPGKVPTAATAATPATATATASFTSPATSAPMSPILVSPTTSLPRSFGAASPVSPLTAAPISAAVSAPVSPAGSLPRSFGTASPLSPMTLLADMPVLAYPVTPEPGVLASPVAQQRYAQEHVAPPPPTTSAPKATTNAYMPFPSSSSRAGGSTDAFAKMSESIAAQSALLMKLQSSMSFNSNSAPMASASSYNFASPPISPCNGSGIIDYDDEEDDRFEYVM